jgi:hypothetical protein
MTYRLLLVFLSWSLAVEASGAEKVPKRALDEATVFELPSGTKPSGGTEQTKRASHSDAVSFAKAIGALSAGVGPENRLVLWEGVPRHGDKTFLEEERRQRKTVTVDGEVFFADSQVMPPDLAEKLRVTVFAGARVARGGMKLCGGFHADFLLKWESATAETEALLCFSCSEVKIYGPGGSLYGDLAKEEYKTLRDLLAPFGKERPKPAAVK